METITLQQQRRRRILLALPLLVLPFATLLFWTLGGGRANSENEVHAPTGFNSHLPEAKLKDEHGLSKLGYYDRAAADSAKLRQALQTDPYARQQVDSVTGHPALGGPTFSPDQHSGLNTSLGNGQTAANANAALISQRLAALQAEVSKPASPAVASRPSVTPTVSAPPVVTTATADDPELKQMSGILEKILDIQHPERVREKINQNATITSEQFKAIPAVVEGNQKIVQGTVIRMQLLDSVRLNGQLFPKGQLIYGTGDLYNQRVKINIKLIHAGLNIIPVDLTVYDRTDGLEGISVPEAVTGDAMRDGAVNGVTSMDVMSFDPSMGAQLATAGINTAKGLFSKKIKRVKGKLKNGHELLLRDNIALKKPGGDYKNIIH